MEWNDHGIVLASRPHGETGIVASLLTRSHGRHAGFVPGGVSRPGRAVSRAAAGPYREKLLVLPAFLSTGGLPSDDVELRLGLDLTGYFLERHVFWPHNKPLPPARARFMEILLQ